MLLVLVLLIVPLLLPLLSPARASADTGGPRWQWPLTPPPRVVRGFEPPAVRWAAGHRGVDLLGRPGATVSAAADGVVSFAGMVAGRPVVAVQHGPLRTTYEPVTSSVRVGQRVTRGAPLGRLHIVAGHCLPRACLHWGLRRGRDYLDPLLLVRRGPPRLLPVWASTGTGRVPVMTPAAGAQQPEPFSPATPVVAAEAGVAADGQSPGPQRNPTSGVLLGGAAAGAVTGAALLAHARRRKGR